VNILPQGKVSSITKMVAEGAGIRRIISELRVAKGTVVRYRNIFLSSNTVFCACGQKVGHRGWCYHRVSLSPSRQAFLSAHPLFGGRVSDSHKRKPIELDRLLRWPYIVYGNNVPDIVIKVHKVVPLSIPEKIRPDICQDIIVDILSGTIEHKDIPGKLRSYINIAYRNVGEYRTRSIYDTVRGTDGLMIVDTISENNLWQ